MPPNAMKDAPILDPVIFLFARPETLVEEADDLARHLFPSCLLMVHDTSRSSQDNVSELTSGQQPHHPLLEICETDVVAGRDDTSLVQAVS